MEFRKGEKCIDTNLSPNHCNYLDTPCETKTSINFINNNYKRKRRFLELYRLVRWGKVFDRNYKSDFHFSQLAKAKLWFEMGFM